MKRGWGLSCLHLFLCARSLSHSYTLSLALSLSRCLSRLVFLLLLFHRRVPSAVSFLAVVGLTNACCPFYVVVALDPSLCRVTSGACPRLSLFSPLSDVRTRVSVLASFLRARRFSVALLLTQGEVYVQEGTTHHPLARLGCGRERRGGRGGFAQAGAVCAVHSSGVRALGRVRP